MTQAEFRGASQDDCLAWHQSHFQTQVFEHLSLSSRNQMKCALPRDPLSAWRAVVDLRNQLDPHRTVALRMTVSGEQTLGFLQPSAAQIPVQTYWEPERFEAWANLAKSIGIRYVISGPFVRSSYRAREALEDIRLLRSKELL